MASRVRGLGGHGVAVRLVLIGDGESPHLLKWARALQPHVELWALSSRGFLPELAGLVPAGRRLALETQPRFDGGNLGLLRHVGRVAAWLTAAQADWLHAHYLTSHGTLAMASRWLGAPGQLCSSAWGSDILVTPARSRLMAALTRRILRSSALCTSDSRHMAQRMHELGAGEVMVFPFGLEHLPTPAADKDDRLFFANRGLEPLYAPQHVLAAFAGMARAWPDARLVLANDGSQREALQAAVQAHGLAGRVQFVGRLPAAAQEALYRRARWYLSLPESDSVSVSVLEAMAHGCVPILSDLPANRELVDTGRNGLIVPDGALPAADELAALLPRADAIAQANRAWVERHALFARSVQAFLARLMAITAAPGDAR